MLVDARAVPQPSPARAEPTSRKDTAPPAPTLLCVVSADTDLLVAMLDTASAMRDSCDVEIGWRRFKAGSVTEVDVKALVTALGDGHVARALQLAYVLAGCDYTLSMQHARFSRARMFEATMLLMRTRPNFDPLADDASVERLVTALIATLTIASRHALIDQRSERVVDALVQSVRAQLKAALAEGRKQPRERGITPLVSMAAHAFDELCSAASLDESGRDAEHVAYVQLFQLAPAEVALPGYLKPHAQRAMHVVGELWQCRPRARHRLPPLAPGYRVRLALASRAFSVHLRGGNERAGSDAALALRARMSLGVMRLLRDEFDPLYDGDPLHPLVTACDVVRVPLTETECAALPTPDAYFTPDVIDVADVLGVFVSEVGTSSNEFEAVRRDVCAVARFRVSSVDVASTACGCKTQCAMSKCGCCRGGRLQWCQAYCANGRACLNQYECRAVFASVSERETFIAARRAALQPLPPPPQRPPPPSRA